MKYILSFLVLVLTNLAFAQPGDIVVSGACTTKCDCWYGYEGEQAYFLSHDSTFICGVTESSPYRCSFDNQLKWTTQGKQYSLELYKSMGETACYFLKKK